MTRWRVWWRGRGCYNAAHFFTLRKNLSLSTCVFPISVARRGFTCNWVELRRWSRVFWILRRTISDDLDLWSTRCWARLALKSLSSKKSGFLDLISIGRHWRAHESIWGNWHSLSSSHSSKCWPMMGWFQSSILVNWLKHNICTICAPMPACVSQGDGWRITQNPLNYEKNSCRHNNQEHDKRMRLMSIFGNMDFWGWQGRDKLGLKFSDLFKLEYNAKQGKDNLP